MSDVKQVNLSLQIGVLSRTRLGCYTRDFKGIECSLGDEEHLDDDLDEEPAG